MCSSSPDVSGVNQAAVNSSNTSADALKWFESTYADEAPDRAAASTQASNVSNAQVAAMNQATTNAAYEQNRNQTEFEPLQDSLVSDAQDYDTPEKEQAAASTAQAGVEGAYGNAQAAGVRQMARMGTNLTGPAAAAEMQDANLQKAKAVAGATQSAVNTVQQQGYARKMDAAGLGLGVVSNQATQQGIANATGNSAVNASNAALSDTESGNALMQTGFNTALQGDQVAGNLYGEAANIGAGSGAANAGAVGMLGQGIGSLYGSGALTSIGNFFSSSKVLKMAKKPMSNEDALKANNKMPVEQWSYKPGAGDGGTHVGPYAEDVQKQFGDSAAPGGKVIHMPTMAANNSKAIAALTAQLSDIEGKIAAVGSKSKPATAMAA